MNNLAKMWAEREAEREAARKSRAEIRKIVLELREVNAIIRPMQKAAYDRHWAGMRQDGTSGFIMVRPQP